MLVNYLFIKLDPKENTIVTQGVNLLSVGWLSGSKITQLSPELTEKRKKDLQNFRLDYKLILPPSLICFQVTFVLYSPYQLFMNIHIAVLDGEEWL